MTTSAMKPEAPFMVSLSNHDNKRAQQTVHLLHPGLVDYDTAWRWQNDTAAALRAGTGPERIAILQHPPTFTLGRHADSSHILIDPESLAARGATVVSTDRGGDVTFHGPGQLVVYPVLDLRRRALHPRAYVHALEETIILTLARFSLDATRIDGRPGVWFGGAKIAAVGVRIHGGISTHGFALNVAPDLSWFDAIVPCGLRDSTVTSMQRALGRSPNLATAEDAFMNAFAAVFDSRLAPSDAGLGAFDGR